MGATPAVDGLGTVNFCAIAEIIVIEHLWGSAVDRMKVELGLAGMYERIDEALEDASPRSGEAHRESRIDKAFLKEVVDVWQSSKIDGVIDRYDVTERTTRRWLKRAKDEGARCRGYGGRPWPAASRSRFRVAGTAGTRGSGSAPWTSARPCSSSCCASPACSSGR